MRIHSPALTAAVGLVSSLALAAGQTREQRRCVVELLAGGLGVAKVQSRTNAACVREAGKGNVPDVAACLAADADGALAEAVAATAEATLAACAETPADFGVPNAFEETVSEAAAVHERGVVADLFGADPNAAMITHGEDRRGAKCQAQVTKRTEAFMIARQKAFVRCVKRALRKGAGDAATLAGCVESNLKGAVSRTARKLRSDVSRRCQGVDLAAAFPGACVNPADTFAACVVTRATCRACRLAATSAALDVDCDLVDDDLENDSCRFPVSVAGHAIPFIGGPDGRIEGARISILEQPGREVTTSADGAFLFEGLEEGSEVTLVMDALGYHPIQTGTIRLGAAGATRVTFQAVTFEIYAKLAAVLGVAPDEVNRCQMVTTVTRVGKSVYDPGAHGEAGVTVTTAPALPAEHGPIYFNASVLPDPTLTETSEDGGALYIQVPPGDYVWTAHKPGALLSRIKQKCRAGFLVNASPPWGLQTHAAPGTSPL